jgi:hypothetical protein
LGNIISLGIFFDLASLDLTLSLNMLLDLRLIAAFIASSSASRLSLDN